MQIRETYGVGTMTRTSIRKLMDDILVRQGRSIDHDETALLRDVGFRSLDFSELALRVEDASGSPLEFEAGTLRAIETVGDVLDFIETSARRAA